MFDEVKHREPFHKVSTVVHVNVNLYRGQSHKVSAPVFKCWSYKADLKWFYKLWV